MARSKFFVRGAFGVAVLFVAATGFGCGGGGGGNDSGQDLGPTICTTNPECDDGLYCNGEERCSPSAQDANAMGCRPGTNAPCITGQICDEVNDSCMTDCSTTGDADGDGENSANCGGADCDDGDLNRFPGNPEVCDLTGHDEDCNPTTFGSRDADRDTYIDAQCCNGTACGNDCDDSRPAVHPGATEVCNGLDEDCDGTPDDGALLMVYPDEDHDLHGDEDATPVMACPSAVGYSPLADDCDDANPAVHRAQVEVCDGVDNNCIDGIDESPASVAWYLDNDQDGFGDASDFLVSCFPPAGRVLRGTDCDDTRSSVNPSANELCNARDDDCNGIADFQVPMGGLEDDDGDGYADSRCATGTDCDDTHADVNALAAEICDGIDNDCDGFADNMQDTTMFWPDVDGDGYGDDDGTPVTACVPPNGHVVRGGDCNDTNPNINPGAVDTCNGVDTDCDGDPDDDAVRSAWFLDSDMDGHHGGTPVITCMGMPPGGVQASTDCNDGAMGVHPGATEVCNSIDDDCEGGIDEGFMQETCGVGECQRTVSQCMGGMPMMCVPGMATSEICNGLNDDCDTLTDEEPGPQASCSDANTIGVCQAGGNCAIAGCLGSHENCNGIVSDGCERDIDTDLEHCGSCDHACFSTDMCVDGRCQNEPIEIVAGTRHTCVLMGSGEVYCWGTNVYGQLGRDPGMTTNMRSEVAIQVPGITDAIDIDAHYDHTCAVLGDRSVVCWGANNCAQLGRNLTTATPTTCTTSAAIFSGTPAPVLTNDMGNPALAGVDTVATGQAHTCAKLMSGRIRCWGYTNSGRTGTTTTSTITQAATPATLNLPADTISMLAAGGEFNMIRLSSPSVNLAAFGGNFVGEIPGTTSTYNLFAGPVSDAAMLAPAHRVSCLLRANGTIICQGTDTNGALGNGPPVANSSSLQAVMGTQDFTRIWGGFEQYCAKRMDGSIWCWGKNDDGQLGLNENPPADRLAPTPMTAVLPGFEVNHVALGFVHTCAILNTLQVVCWGLNDSGQLGNNTTNTAWGNAVFVQGLPTGGP